MTSSLIHGLLRSVLFNLQIFVSFFRYHSVIDFQFNSAVVREHAFHAFNYFKFAKGCVITQNMICLDELPYTSEQNAALPLLSEMFSRSQVKCTDSVFRCFCLC